MAHPGRPATKLQITDAERAELKARLRVRKAPEDEKLRMRIVLGCADGESGTVIAQRLHTTVQTVCCVTRWRAATTLLSRPSAHASTMRARRAKACAVLRRLANAISCSRSVALNTNGVFGLALMATSSCNTLHE